MIVNKKFRMEQDIILDSITDGVFTVDLNWCITSFNKAAEKITGIPREKAIDQLCKEVLRANICEGNCALRKTLKNGKSIISEPVIIIDANGDHRPISISTAVLKDKHGKIIGGVESFRDLKEIEQLRKEIMRSYSLEEIITCNHRMLNIFDILPQVAESDSTILIEGESGTGKELFARAIHNLSPRRKKPFIAINCGSLPDSLLESELFGYKKGAFTDAKKDKPGRFELAEKGTLFLDEIGDISPALQVRLLRFLQDHIYEPLGSVKSVAADVRVIAATNKNLLNLVQERKFRQDLFYRINVVRIEIPPLRERMEDVPLLVENFISKMNSIKNKGVTALTNKALTCLMSYDFPGNVRELENIIERAFVLCKSGVIESKHLPEPLCTIPCYECPKQLTFKSLKQMEASFLMYVLHKNYWNKLKTAHELGIHKTTLYRKIKSLGLKIPSLKKQSPPPKKI